jgi:anti-sigma factor RsiW
MYCRRFRALHANYLDDTLSGEQMDAMRAHRAQCAGCSTHDARMRRALMLARNATPIEVSADFGQRLAARLAAEVPLAPVATRPWWGGPAIGLSVATVGLAATLLVIVSNTTRGPAPVVAHAAVVVMPPAVPAEPLAAPAMFGTVGSSLPVYPAMLMAQRATEYFAATHVQTVSFQATR